MHASRAQYARQPDTPRSLSGPGASWKSMHKKKRLSYNSSCHLPLPARSQLVQSIRAHCQNRSNCALRQRAIDAAFFPVEERVQTAGERLTRPPFPIGPAGISSYRRERKRGEWKMRRNWDEYRDSKSEDLLLPCIRSRYNPAAVGYFKKFELSFIKKHCLLKITGERLICSRNGSP